MKKKVFTILTATVLLVTLSACGNKDTSTSSSSKSSISESKKSDSSKSSESSESKSNNTTSNTNSTDHFDTMISAAQSQTEQIKKQSNGTYSNIEVEKGDNHTIVYKYTYAKDPGIEIDAAALKPTLVKGMKPVIDGIKVMVPDVKIRVIYLKPDKTELANILITQSDTDAVN